MTVFAIKFTIGLDEAIKYGIMEGKEKGMSWVLNCRVIKMPLQLSLLQSSPLIGINKRE